MTNPIDDAVRVRVIRAILGMSSKAFAARVGVSAGTLTAWSERAPHLKCSTVTSWRSSARSTKSHLPPLDSRYPRPMY